MQGSSLGLRNGLALSWPDVLLSSRYGFSLLLYGQKNIKQEKVLGEKVLHLRHRLTPPNPT